MNPMIGAALISLVPALADLLFGNKNQSQEVVTKTETAPRGYQSPLIGLMDTTIGSSLLSGLQNYSGAGGGATFSPQISDILNLLSGETTDLIKGYQTGGTCQEKCQSEHDARIANGMDAAQAARLRNNCLANCRGVNVVV